MCARASCSVVLVVEAYVGVDARYVFGDTVCLEPFAFVLGGLEEQLILGLHEGGGKRFDVVGEGGKLFLECLLRRQFAVFGTGIRISTEAVVEGEKFQPRGAVVAKCGVLPGGIFEEGFDLAVSVGGVVVRLVCGELVEVEWVTLLGSRCRVFGW